MCRVSVHARTRVRTAGVRFLVLEKVPVESILFGVRVAPDRIAKAARVLGRGLAHFDVAAVMAHHAAGQRRPARQHDLGEEAREHSQFPASEVSGHA